MAARTARRRPMPIQDDGTSPPEPELRDIATVLDVAAFTVERRALTGHRHRLRQVAVDVRASAAALREVEDQPRIEDVEVTREQIRRIEAKALQMVRRRRRTAGLRERRS